MCGYSCIGFIDLMLKGKRLTEFADLFSPNNQKKLWYNFKLFNEIKDYFIAEIRKAW